MKLTAMMSGADEDRYTLIDRPREFWEKLIELQNILIKMIDDVQDAEAPIPAYISVNTICLTYESIYDEKLSDEMSDELWMAGDLPLENLDISRSMVWINIFDNSFDLELAGGFSCAATLMTKELKRFLKKHEPSDTTGRYPRVSSDAPDDPPYEDIPSDIEDE